MTTVWLVTQTEVTNDTTTIRKIVCSTQEHMERLVLSLLENSICMLRPRVFTAIPMEDIEKFWTLRTFVDKIVWWYKHFNPSGTADFPTEDTTRWFFILSTYKHLEIEKLPMT